MSRQRWKRAEREIASLLGGVRLPNNGFGQPDVIAGQLAVQVKTKAALPAWFTDAVDQSSRDASPDQWPAVIVAHARRGHPTRRYLVAAPAMTWPIRPPVRMRWSDATAASRRCRNG